MQTQNPVSVPDAPDVELILSCIKSKVKSSHTITGEFLYIHLRATAMTTQEKIQEVELPCEFSSFDSNVPGKFCPSIK